MNIIFVAAFAAGFALTLLLVPPAKRLAVAMGALDKPNARKVHKAPIPLWGGLGVFGGFVLSFASILYFLPFREMLTERSVMQALGMIAAGTAMVITGMIDDRFGMPAKVKLLCQLVTGAMMYWFGIRIEYLTIPFYGVVFLAPWQGFGITLFWIAGITNALNLLDGLDGLLAGVSMTTALVFLAVSIIKGQPLVGVAMACVAGCALGFLRYNFNPAQIFMGDTGSLFFGMMFAGWSIIGLFKSTATVALFIPVLLMAVPIFDTSFAIVRRFLAGRPIFSPDKGHLHHRLLNKGLTQKQAVLVIYAINTFFGLLGLALVLLFTKGA